jgi:aminopeptidase-like protein
MSNNVESTSKLVRNLVNGVDPQQEGALAYAMIERLYPICRSITGNGVRESLHLLQETLPLTLREIPSGTEVFDWVVPDEWNIRDAYIINAKGERIVDFHRSNLHVLNYSVPVDRKLSWSLQGTSLRYSYRFLWIPGTIGSITWLALNESILPRIKHGLVLSCVGDSGKFTYKRSRRGDAEVDRVVEQVLRQTGREHQMLDFTPYGYDERQYCSPGIDLPVGCFMRTPNGCYPQYHTSADDLSLVKPSALGDSLIQLLRVIRVLDENRCYVNLNPKCEPQLGRRGLYRQLGGTKDPAALQMAMLWVLNFSDGRHDLLDIAIRSDLPFEQISEAAEVLRGAGLLG